MFFYRARGLRVVIGRVGFKKTDSPHDNTIIWWLPVECKSAKSPVDLYWDSKHQLLNAHAWLESDDHKVFDKITESVIAGAIQRNRPLKYDVDQVLEGVSYAEMTSRGLTYLPAPIDVQIAAFDKWWITTKGGLTFPRSQIRVGH